MWEFEIINDWEVGLKRAEKNYKSACNRHVFAHPALLKAWIDTYIPLRKLEPVIIIGKSQNENFFSLPLVLWKRNWKNAFEKLLIPVGYSDLDYHDPLFKNPISKKDKNLFWTELTDFLRKNISFDRVVIDGITDSIISDSKAWKKGEICPLLDLKDIKDEESLMKFFKSSLRGDIRRQMRRLTEELGEIKLIEYNSFGDVPQETINKFLNNHRKRWPNAYKAPHFHENLLKLGIDEGTVHFSVLKTGQTEVAWHLGFQDDGRYYYYMPAGNQNYLKFSPVKVHLFLLVKRAIERNFKIFDHLRGEENYKQGWSNDSKYVNSLQMKNKKTSSAIKSSILNLKNKI